MKRRHFKTRWRLLKRAFRRFLSGKISRRLIFSYVGLGVLPIVVVSIFLITLTQSTVQTYIYQRNLETARRASNEIFLFIQSPLTILNTIAYTRDILEMEKFSQSRLINRIKEENSIFHKIFIVDNRGIVQVTTSFGEEQMDFSREAFFRTAMQGKEFLSEVYFTPSRFPVLLIAEPLVRFDQTLGVLAAEIDLKNIWDLVDNITIGKTGNAFLLSNSGIVIAHKEKEKVLEKEDYSGFAFFEQLRQGLEGITRYTMDGETMIAAYVPIPKLGWGIVIQQSQQEAFTLAFQMQKRVIFFVVLTTLIAMVLAYLAVQRLTSPLVELVRGVREYASGNLNHRIRLQRQDELAELAQEFNSMARSLQQNQKELQRMERLAALSRFASLVSHEIRNPLNSMNINMQILKKLINRSDVPPDRKIKYLHVLSSEISRINDLVTNFLVIARPPELNLIRTDIHRVLEEVLLLQEARANTEGIKIHRRYANDEITGMFDHNQLKQVFHNIVINALEAMPHGGELTVRTEVVQRDKSSDQSQRYVRIVFQDNGRGIPPEIINEVFEFYYTTKKTGTGLGLAIAKQIVEGHQGFIYINSWPNKGTKVFIELPIDSGQ